MWTHALNTRMRTIPLPLPCGGGTLSRLSTWVEKSIHGGSVPRCDDMLERSRRKRSGRGRRWPQRLREAAKSSTAIDVRAKLRSAKMPRKTESMLQFDAESGCGVSAVLKRCFEPEKWGFSSQMWMCSEAVAAAGERLVVFDSAVSCDCSACSSCAACWLSHDVSRGTFSRLLVVRLLVMIQGNTNSSRQGAIVILPCKATLVLGARCSILVRSWNECSFPINAEHKT